MSEIALVIDQPVVVQSPGELGDPQPVLLTAQDQAAENGVWHFHGPDEPMTRTGSWFYLSFADGRLPAGTQWLGSCYVRAVEGATAIARAHALGINPGGEVKFVGPIPQETIDEAVPARDRERLLNRQDLKAHGPIEPWGANA